MYHFMQNLSYYMMEEVLEPNWHEFESKLAGLQTVDQLLEYHSAFLDKCLKACLLTNLPLFKLLRKIMDLCVMFCQNIEKFSSSISVSDSPAVVGRDVLKSRKARLAIEAEAMRTGVSHPRYTMMVSKVSAKFEDRVGEFMRFLAEKCSSAVDSHLANLFTRLDYNGFYSQRFQLADASA